MKDNIQISNKHMKRCSTLLVIREMHIKIIMRYHYTLIRVAVILKTNDTNVDENTKILNLHTFLLRILNDTSTLKTNLAIS